MTTQTLIDADRIMKLMGRGWDLSSERHGWDALCLTCGWTENYLSLTGLESGCDAHDRQCHLPKRDKLTGSGVFASGQLVI
jgi:hypothetical protein